MHNSSRRLSVTPPLGHTGGLTSERERGGGWSAPVDVPGTLEDLHGPTSGQLRLPVRVYSSADGPRRVWDLEDPAARAEFYAVVMENAALPDVTAYLDAGMLRALWPTMWLSPHVRRAWAPLLEHDTATA